MAKYEDGNTLTDTEILDEVETFMFEGHDTTSSGVAFALYNLAKHTEYQQKARAEVQSVLGKRSYIGWEDLPK